MNWQKRAEMQKKSEKPESPCLAQKDRTLMNGRFKSLTETTAAQLANINKTALAYINGELSEVYSINYNALEQFVDGVGGYTFALVSTY